MRRFIFRKWSKSKLPKLYFFFLLIAFVFANSGTYTVTGLGKRKQAILNAGGGSWDIAIAMHETKNLDTDYIYGDEKSDDSTNFGIFKQNWFILGTSTTQLKSYISSSSYNNGNALKSNLSQDIKAKQESQKIYGPDQWFAGHRMGETGISNPYTEDINNY